MNETPKGPAIDPFSLPGVRSTDYPAPFDEDVAGREERVLGEAFKLTNFGINMITLAPGAMSSQRHWHTKQDEFVYMVDGELVLVTDEGDQIMTPGMVVGFAAGVTNGHHLVNRSGRDAAFLVVGDRTSGDEAGYSDIDMRFNDQGLFTHKNGTPYTTKDEG